MKTYKKTLDKKEIKRCIDAIFDVLEGDLKFDAPTASMAIQIIHEEFKKSGYRGIRLYSTKEEAMGAKKK